MQLQHMQPKRVCAGSPLDGACGRNRQDKGRCSSNRRRSSSTNSLPASLTCAICSIQVSSAVPKFMKTLCFCSGIRGCCGCSLLRLCCCCSPWLRAPTPQLQGLALRQQRPAAARVAVEVRGVCPGSWEVVVPRFDLAAAAVEGCSCVLQWEAACSGCRCPQPTHPAALVAAQQQQAASLQLSKSCDDLAAAVPPSLRCKALHLRIRSACPVQT